MLDFYVEVLYEYLEDYLAVYFCFTLSNKAFLNKTETSINFSMINFFYKNSIKINAFSLQEILSFRIQSIIFPFNKIPK